MHRSVVGNRHSPRWAGAAPSKSRRGPRDKGISGEGLDSNRPREEEGLRRMKTVHDCVDAGSAHERPTRASPPPGTIEPSISTDEPVLGCEGSQAFRDRCGHYVG